MGYLTEYYGKTGKKSSIITTPTKTSTGGGYLQQYQAQQQKKTTVTPTKKVSTTPVKTNIQPQKTAVKAKEKSFFDKAFSLFVGVNNEPVRQAKQVAESFKTIKPSLETFAGVTAKFLGQQQEKTKEQYRKFYETQKKKSPEKFKDVSFEQWHKKFALAGGKQPVSKETLDKKGNELIAKGMQGTARVQKERSEKLGDRDGVAGFIDDLAFSVAPTVTSLGLGFVTGYVTKRPDLGVKVGLSYTFSQGVSEVYRSAKQEGMADKEAERVAVVGGVAYAILNKLPIGRLLERAPNGEQIKKTFLQKLSQGLVSTGKQSILEGMAEGGEQVVSNVLSQMYSENPDIFKGVPESILAGSIMGSGADVAFNTVGSISNQIKKQLGAEVAQSEEKIAEALSTPVEERNEEQKEIISTMLSRTASPQEVLALVLDTPLEKTSEGKEIIKMVALAQKNGQQLTITGNEDGEIEVSITDGSDSVQIDQPSVSSEEENQVDKVEEEQVEQLPKSEENSNLAKYSLEQGKHKYTFIRNTEKAPKATPDDRFGQKIEPAGKYMTISTPDNAQRFMSQPGLQNYETGTIEFKNPLIIEQGESTRAWKDRLSKQYGGKKGKELTQALVKDGYDGIITLEENGEPSEVIHFDRQLNNDAQERLTDIKLYSGSNKLKGSRYFSESKNYAQAYGSNIRELNIPKDEIFDIRIPEHKAIFDSIQPELKINNEIDNKTGLIKSQGDAKEIEKALEKAGYSFKAIALSENTGVKGEPLSEISYFVKPNVAQQQIGQERISDTKSEEVQEAVNLISGAIASGDNEAVVELYNSLSQDVTLPPLEDIQAQVEQEQEQELMEVREELEKIADEQRSANPEDPTNQLLDIADKLANHFKRPKAIFKITGKERTYSVDEGARTESMMVGGDTAEALDRLIYATDITGLKKNLNILHKKFDKVFTELYNKEIDGGDYEQFKERFRKQFQSRVTDRTGRRKSIQNSPGRQQSTKSETSNQTNESNTSKKSSRLDQKFEYQSTQLNLPSNVSKKVIDLGNTVAEEDIAPDPTDNYDASITGREKDPHITVLYGLDNKVDENAVREVLKDTAPITVKLGKTSLFEGDERDVLKIDVNSLELRAVNKAIDSALDTPGKTFNDYKPHVTVAYIKKGTGDKYTGDATLEGEEITFNSLAFSRQDGSQVEIPLTGKKEIDQKASSKAKKETPVKRSVTLSKDAQQFIDALKKENQKEIEFADKDLPVGTGKLKNSRLYERITETAEGELKADLEARMVKYNVLDLKEQGRKIADMIDKDPEKATRIARGLEEVPTGMTPTAMAVALAEVARNEGDFKTTSQMWTRASLMATRAGQEIVSLRGSFNGDLEMNIVRQILNERMEKLSKRYSDVIAGLSVPLDAPTTKKVDALIKHEAKKLKKKMTDQQKKRFKSADELFKELTCK